MYAPEPRCKMHALMLTRYMSVLRMKVMAHTPLVTYDAAYTSGWPQLADDVISRMYWMVKGYRKIMLNCRRRKHDSMTSTVKALCHTAAASSQTVPTHSPPWLVTAATSAWTRLSQDEVKNCYVNVKMNCMASLPAPCRTKRC